MKSTQRKSPFLSLPYGLFIFLLTILFTINSCNDETTKSNKEDSKEMAEDQNEAKFNKTGEKDAEFLVSAAEINLEEIQLGKLAQSNSKTPDVTRLGSMMETEHQAVLKELDALAASKQVTVPATITEKGQDAYDKLKDKTGKDFDKKYTEMMVDGHKDAIDKFEKAAKDCADADIRNWANKQLPALRTHLTHAEAARDAVDKK